MKNNDVSDNSEGCQLNGSRELKIIDKEMELVISSRNRISSLEYAPIVNQLKMGIPCTIYVQNNSCLKELKRVKIVWSTSQNCYELIQEETVRKNSL